MNCNGCGKNYKAHEEKGFAELCPDCLRVLEADYQDFFQSSGPQDITVLPADDPKKLRLGWVVYETVGVAVINDYATAKVTIT